MDDLEDLNVEGQDGGRRTKAKYMRMFVSRKAGVPVSWWMLIVVREF